MLSSDLEEEMNCAICLDIFRDPVMLRCGHNFCRDCINLVLDNQKPPGGYSCPECRENFPQRPELQRNLILRKMVESLLSTRPDERTGVRCTYCMDSSSVAVKSCLMCEASLCDKHLKVHSKAPGHVLTKPTASLENYKCQVHKELLKYYCAEDSVCVCMTCILVGDHQGHQMETLEKAAETRKTKLRNIRQELIGKREKSKEKNVSLQQCRKRRQEEASESRDRVNDRFVAIRKELEDLEKRTLREITSQKDQVLLRVANLIRKEETKTNELSQKIDRLEKMCDATDPLALLQETDAGDAGDPENVDEELRESPVRAAGDLDVTVISQSLNALSDVLAGINGGIYVNRKVGVMLNENTAGSNLGISNDGKTAFESLSLKRPETADRFQFPQVMSTTSFSSGRHTWEVEIRTFNHINWRIGMCYPSIDRKGQSSNLGYNKKSWCLRRSFDNFYTARHDNTIVGIANNISSNKIRVCLDYEAGTLSFYELGTSVEHLHTFTATFTEPLHAALCVWGGSLKICG